MPRTPEQEAELRAHVQEQLDRHEARRRARLQAQAAAYAARPPVVPPEPPVWTPQPVAAPDGQFWDGQRWVSVWPAIASPPPPAAAVRISTSPNPTMPAAQRFVGESNQTFPATQRYSPPSPAEPQPIRMGAPPLGQWATQVYFEPAPRRQGDPLRAPDWIAWERRR
jgi:hypothetical protein